jgi:hypothetical protein
MSGIKFWKDTGDHSKTSATSQGVKIDGNDGKRRKVISHKVSDENEKSRGQVEMPVVLERPTNISEGYFLSDNSFSASRSHCGPNPFFGINRMALACVNGFGAVTNQASYGTGPGSFGHPFVEGAFLVTLGDASLHFNSKRLCSPNGRKDCSGLALSVNAVVGAPIYLLADEFVNITFISTRTSERGTSSSTAINEGIYFTTDCIGGSTASRMNLLSDDENVPYPNSVPTLAPEPLCFTNLIRSGDTRTIRVLRDWVGMQSMYCCESGATLTGVQVRVFLQPDIRACPGRN